MKIRTLILILLAACLALLATQFVLRKSSSQNRASSQGSESTSTNPSGSSEEKTAATATGPSRTNGTGNMSSGQGASQSAQGEAKTGKSNPATVEELRTPQNYGRAVSVKAVANPQAASVLEALKTGTHPERLTAMVPAPPFDKAKFLADPQSYLREIVPGRCQQCAEPSPTTPALQAIGPRFHNLNQGESVKLTVKGAPKFPVNFTSMDMGSFRESSLPCVSVQADENGLASVTFVASAGALNDVNILVASPMASHQVAYKIEITEKK